MKHTGIIIVTYNSASFIDGCLEAAVRQGPEVVVVDNASVDATCEIVRRWPGVRLIANARNRGFAAAVNQGVAEVSSDHVLLLNPDAVLLTSVEDLVEACSQPGVAAAGGKLVDAAGRPQHGFAVRRFPTPVALAFEALGFNRLFPGNPVNRRYRCLDMSLEEAADVEQPAGAFLMMRRKVWEELGGLDEGFHPIWFEDVDLLRRIKDRGYSARYVPTAVARHHGGHSVTSLSWGCRQEYWYGSLLRYAAKHFRWLGRSGLCAAVILGCAVRLVAGICMERSLTPLAIYGKVVRLASAHLLSGRTGRVNGSPLLARR